MERFETLKKKYLNKAIDSFNQLNKSNSENKLSDLIANFDTLSKKMTTIGNGIAKDFVDELNTDEFNEFSFEIKEKINNEFREELKNVIINKTKKFIV
jgi:hypothetical protein